MLTLKQSRRLRNALLGLLCWGIALLLFFPIFWMLLTSFKSEIDAFATPPQFIFQPTLENYLHINERSDFAYAWNSLLISSSATLLCMLVAVPAASHGLLRDPPHQAHAALDAVDQDASAGRRTDADLPAGQAVRPARFAAGADHRLHPDQPADRGLDGVHLLQDIPWTSSKQRAWTAPAPGRRSSACCCRSPAAGSPRPCCCR